VKFIFRSINKLFLFSLIISLTSIRMFDLFLFSLIPLTSIRRFTIIFLKLFVVSINWFYLSYYEKEPQKILCAFSRSNNNCRACSGSSSSLALILLRIINLSKKQNKDHIMTLKNNYQFFNLDFHSISPFTEEIRFMLLRRSPNIGCNWSTATWLSLIASISVINDYFNENKNIKWKILLEQLLLHAL
jgi:hypothetical protein